MRRWGRATIQLEQHSGAIDGAFLRRLLREQAEAVCPAEGPAGEVETATSLIVRLGPTPDNLPLAWCAFGPPAASVYLPVAACGGPAGGFGDSDGRGQPAVARPERLARGQPARRAIAGGGAVGPGRAAAATGRLTHEFAAEAGLLHRRGDCEGLRRLAGSFMQHSCERFEELAGFAGPAPRSEDSRSERPNWPCPGRSSR